MRLFGKKGGNFKKFIWISILLALPLGFLLKESLQLYAMKERLAAQEKETARIQQQITQLEQEREKLKKAEADTIEKLAREKMKFTKPGEVIYVASTTE